MKLIKYVLLFMGSVFTTQVVASPGLTEALTSSNPLLLSEFISTHSLFLYLGVFFLLGVLLAFTPCVLPMVPILSGIIIQQERHRSFRLSLSYVLGMALMYALAGMGAAVAGASLQASLQNPYVISVFSMVFVILGFNLLGLFEIKLPQFNFMQKRGKKASYGKTALMGALSTLIVSPCVTAPLIGVLSYIAQTQQVLLGGLILFVLALGMGVPLLLVGAGGNRFLPKTGPWMNGIKYAFGFMMFGVAIYLMSRVLPAHITPLLSAGLLIGMGLFVAMKNLSQHKLIYGFSISVCAFGLSSFYQGVSALHHPASISSSTAPFQTANSVPDIKKALTLAKAHHQKVFLEFYASWCEDCQAMDEKVFSQSHIRTAMKGFTNIRVDITEDTQIQRDIKKVFHIYGTPTLQFYDADGKLEEKLTAAGFVNKNNFLALLKKA